MIYKGIAVSSGLGVAKCLMLVEPDSNDHIKGNKEEWHSEEQKTKLTEAFTKAVIQLETIKQRAEAKGGVDWIEIIESQIMLVKDPALSKSMSEKIELQHVFASEAVQKTIDEQVSIFESIDDDYLKERIQDVQDIGRRLLNNVLGIEEKDISNLEEDVILAGKLITPSQIASADREKVKGIVTESGGKTSHTAILAKNMEIPAVFGCAGICDSLKDGLLIAVDGSEGTVLTEVTPEREAALRIDINKRESVKTSLKEMAIKPTLTKDGVAVKLFVNIMSPDDVYKALEVGADGVGLYRTEFLFMDRHSAPTEEEQYKAYRQVLEAMGDRPVTIRTMDIGGDKEIAYLNLPKEENPFIGYRAIRICLNDIPLFKTQLRAILRASIHGKALIMYPMISSVEEVRAANAILAEVKEELQEEGAKFDEQIPVGIMIEVPSAAVTADILIKEVDFFSIGTNDLTQYTLAVDRMNEKLNALYNPYQPGVLRLIDKVISTAENAGGAKFSAMCGEFAADPMATLLLLGMGLHEFSVNPSSLLRIKKLISLADMAFAKEVVQKAMELSTAAEIEDYLRKVTSEVMGEYFY